jgi:hypothetical protein
MIGTARSVARPYRRLILGPASVHMIFFLNGEDEEEKPDHQLEYCAFFILHLICAG